jgi:hypothetical protein
MTAGRIIVKRIVFDLDRQAQDPAAMRMAAELAEWLQVDLFGRFRDDPDLDHLAELPVVREFRILEREWHSPSPDGASEAKELAIRTARRLFLDAARAASVNYRFAVSQTSEGAPFAENDDIVVVRQRNLGPDTLTRLLDGILASAAGALILPAQIIRRRGPVVAVAKDAEDPSVETAARLAQAAGETVMLFDPPAGGQVPGNHGRRHPAFGRLGERLIVMSRGVLTDLALLSVATRRRVPVLVLRPED